ncbi:hypothetical protein [Senegalia massiliensis]|uniref:hypothetical protein n=1 Tax=Senegalia massiliensis TaxID=1720316 RepID=UPI001F5EC345|nr:hypothetical protein [Senegalia massiliensis]
MSKSKKLKAKTNYKWIIIITIWTFFLAIAVSLLAENVMRNFNILFAFITLIFIILLGVFFDTIGIAVAAAREKPFHSMAAQNNKAARYSIKLIKNAGVVSNFCNDVIGDICGIISGAAGAIIVFKITNFYDIKELTTLSVVMSGFIASLTVGGKAIGKEIAINYSKNIMYYTGKVVMFFDNKLNLKILDK